MQFFRLAWSLTLRAGALRALWVASLERLNLVNLLAKRPPRPTSPCNIQAARIKAHRPTTGGSTMSRRQGLT